MPHCAKQFHWINSFTFYNFKMNSLLESIFCWWKIGISSKGRHLLMSSFCLFYSPSHCFYQFFCSRVDPWHRHGPLEDSIPKLQQLAQELTYIPKWPSEGYPRDLSWNYGKEVLPCFIWIFILIMQALGGQGNSCYDLGSIYLRNKRKAEQ